MQGGEKAVDLECGREAPGHEQDSCPLGAKQLDAHLGERQQWTVDGINSEKMFDF